MTESLFKIYKKFYQRSYRNPYDFELKEISDAVLEIIKDLYNSSNDIEKHLLIKSNAILLAKEIHHREIDTRPQILFSLDLIKEHFFEQVNFSLP